MSGTELNYRNMYPMGYVCKPFKVKKGNFDIRVHRSVIYHKGVRQPNHPHVNYLH